MTSARCRLGVGFAALFFCCLLNAQQQAGSSQSLIVPRLVNFSGKTADGPEKVISGIVGITFAIYKDQYRGSPLWLESQNVQADAKGNYTAQLGATKPEGLPLDLFTSGEARWLGVTVNGGQEQSRVLLLSVPYALKAADAETVGGLPASAFVLAARPTDSAGITSAAAESQTSVPSFVVPPPATSSVTTSGGTINALPLWTTSTNIQSSAITQTGSGSSARVGIDITAPASTLDVNGGETVRGNLSLPATGTATTTSGKNSQPTTLTASVFNSSTGSAVSQNFRWQAEPTKNNTSSAGGTLNLLFGAGSNTPAETGLKIASNGQITFANGQTFSGAGTVKSVALSAPSDFHVSGSPVTNSGTLALSWVNPPASSATPNALVKRDANAGFIARLIQAASISADSGNTGIAILGFSSSSDGIRGTSSSAGSGVSGFSTGGGYGIYGSGSAAGVYGAASDSGAPGVWGVSSLSDGVFGVAYGNASGVSGSGDNGTGVSGTSYNGIGVFGESLSDGGEGVYADNAAAGDGLFAISAAGWAGFFLGDVDVDGTLSKAAGSFKIDHPLDPANRYLFHSFVESPDMMNLYNGMVMLDERGEAVVQLPAWFEALNRDFRYQLTCIGGFAPVYVAEEISHHQFRIAGGRAGTKVSWQVTGIRHDAYADARRIPVEETKPDKERGFYLHPELFGAPEEKGIAWARHPETMRRTKELRKKPASGTPQAATSKNGP